MLLLCDASRDLMCSRDASLFLNKDFLYSQFTFCCNKNQSEKKTKWVLILVPGEERV